MDSLAAIILAAGKGTRINAKKINKVVLPLGKKPMIARTIDVLEELRIDPIIVVVGFAKKSVMDLLKNRVIFAVQKKRLGTAHAVLCGLKYFMDANATDVLVLNGDDSAFFKKKTIGNLIKKHLEKNSSITFLTVEIENPEGLGRIVRDKEDKLLEIVEDKDAKDWIKNIKEVNPACYVFKVSLLRNYLKRIPRSKVTGEYYLTRLIDIAIKNNEKVETVRAGKLSWRGINTKEELKQAERLFLQAK